MHDAVHKDRQLNDDYAAEALREPRVVQHIQDALLSDAHAGRSRRRAWFAPIAVLVVSKICDYVSQNPRDYSVWQTGRSAGMPRSRHLAEIITHNEPRLWIGRMTPLLEKSAVYLLGNECPSVQPRCVDGPWLSCWAHQGMR